MGKINQGILGGFRGKVGNVVGFFWKGKAIMRGLAGSVGNPQTASQMAVRYAFRVLVQIAAPMSGLLAETFKSVSESKKITGGNAFTSANYGKAVIANPTDPTIPTEDWTKLVIAPQVGSGVQVSTPGVAQGTGYTLDFSWSDNSGISPSTLSSDKVGVAIVVPTENAAEFDMESATRGDEALTFGYSPILSGKQAYVYMFTRSVDGSNQCISSNIGVITLG